MSIGLVLPPSVLQHSSLPQCVLHNGRGRTSLLHTHITSTKRDDSLGAWAIRNTGLTVIKPFSISSLKKCVEQLIFAIIPQVWCWPYFNFAFSIFQPIYSCIRLLLPSLKCGLESGEHQTLYRGTENTKCQDLLFAILYDKDR